MEDKLLGLANGFEILATADLAQHVGDAGRARLFECGEDA